MTGFEFIDKLGIADAERVHSFVHGILNAISRFDIDSAVDRLLFKEGWGHLLGLPALGGTSSNATTGVPTNGIAGFAHGAIFLNYKGTGAGTALYVNTGTQTSATWTNVV